MNYFAGLHEDGSFCHTVHGKMCIFETKEQAKKGHEEVVTVKVEEI